MSNASPGHQRTKSTMSSHDSGRSNSQSPSLKFPFDVLIHVLYGKKTSEPVDVQNLPQTDRNKTYCDVCRADRPPNGCRLHAIHKTADQEDRCLSYAIKSFPPEVQLCTSSIPGALYGVCAKKLIPEGTWIGPYEGRRVKPEELVSNRDNSFIWEIYEGDQASCYIDGSDENASSWMRFIRCARCKQEQNLYAFQYLGNVFYRSFKEIFPGTEMLVWYDDKYPQHMGIPVGLQEIEFVSAIDMENNNTAASMTSQANLDLQRRDHHFNMMQRALPSMRSNPTDHALSQTIISSHDSYRNPISPLDDPAKLPASVYGNSFPVNISSGLPSTGRMPGRVHTGMTGIMTRDQEGPAYHYGGNRMTSSHIPGNPELISTDTRSSHDVHAHPANYPVMSSQHHVYSGVRTPLSNVTVVSVNNDIRTSLQDGRGLRQPLYHEEVTEEALRERGYPVKDDSRQTRSLRKTRQSPSRHGVYINKDDNEDDDVIEKRARLPSDEQQQHNDFQDDAKSNCSDSNSSNISTKETVGSAADEISMWRCRQCQKTFTQRVQLQIHICPNEPFKPYRCGQCEVSFHTAPELRSHVDSHASEKPFKCGFCSRSFAGATTLNNHIRAHMGKKPFHCECGKSFTQPVQLARHQKTPGECEHFSKLQTDGRKDKNGT